MAQKPAPLSDLSFFRFPGLTPEVARNIVLLVLLLALTVLVTVLAQRWVQRHLHRRGRRSSFGRFASEHHLQPEVRAVLRSLMERAGQRDEFAFVHDAEAFEQAVQAMLAESDDAQLAALAHLRRTFHLNVMNPELALVSTRQLLADLPVRVQASAGEEWLDLYCAVLRVDERYLMLDLPREEDVVGLLEAYPQVDLLYWREREGETLFHLTLEPVAVEGFPAFRAAHAFRDPEAQQRSDFRLTLDVPAEFTYLERGLLGRRGAEAGRHALHGQAQLVDVSYGGASLLVAEPLAEQGFAQLNFELQGQPLRAMMEVLHSIPASEGRFLVRGQFRGLGGEVRGRLNAVLYREQLKRLRDKDVLVQRRTP